MQRPRTLPRSHQGFQYPQRFFHRSHKQFICGTPHKQPPFATKPRDIPPPPPPPQPDLPAHVIKEIKDLRYELQNREFELRAALDKEYSLECRVAELRHRNSNLQADKKMLAEALERLKKYGNHVQHETPRINYFYFLDRLKKNSWSGDGSQPGEKLAFWGRHALWVYVGYKVGEKTNEYLTT